MRTSFTIAIAATLYTLSFAALSDYTIDRGAIRDWRPQDVVITFGQDPTTHTEQACLVLTMGQLLRQSNPLDNVTLFVRNDGVALANAEPATCS